ncbi:MAG: GTP cyclohydrolase I FolE [Candidatus Edwardsbacteria bacterium]|nr:GTP cyclohydrolase I FolE [Candidatus Edwardsbacteria bacterium]MBU1576394.1 GTP cyclohydrolase I FolE [Candidatus Edwardsbacteria bacterium]MBU2464029.1 GTP cyclohydrolase I FolE [Candidatus Edwardsbacteria bacterium]MBU2593571.1 GTP cyclohydrolase I FolE [Candidatus Edwardsbacteria bacterium]
MTSQKSRPKASAGIDIAGIEKAIRQLLLAIGEDPEREGLKETPCRVARMYQEILSGMADDPIDQLTVYTAKNEDEMILVKDISFYSVCEHHLLPFFGRVHIAYIPRNNKITGFSSLVKVVEAMAKRLQLQERLAADIADLIMKKLKPLGVLVVVEAEHLCLTMRGVKKPGSSVVTSAIRGGMKRESTRLEALSLIKGR